MSYTRFKTRDANRWGKKYPFVRVRKVPMIVGTSEIWIEAVEITFDGINEITYHFECNFPGTPVVTATALDSSDLDVSNVNIFIESVDQYTVTIGSSQVFTGTVMLQAIYIHE